ncbi:MAG: hypothetical protein ACHQUC_04895 [Chlamydiales bacterium]
MIHPDSPIEWSQTLQQAVSQHQYIHQEGSTYSVSNKREGKLSIDDIVKISAMVLKESAPEERESLGGDRVKEMPSDIKTYTEQLINARVAKRDHNTLRNIAKVISFLGSFVLIGLPFYLALKNGDKEFQNQIDQLRRDLEQAAPQKSQSSSVAQSPVGAEASNPKAAREAMIKDLRAQYKSAQSQVTIQKEMSERLQKEKSVMNPDEFNHFEKEQQSLLKYHESTLQGIARQLQELGVSPIVKAEATLPIPEPSTSIDRATVAAELRSLQETETQLQNSINALTTSIHSAVMTGRVPAAADANNLFEMKSDLEVLQSQIREKKRLLS